MSKSREILVEGVDTARPVIPDVDLHAFPRPVQVSSGNVGREVCCAGFKF